MDVLRALEAGDITRAFHKAEAAKYIGRVVVFDGAEIDIASTAGRIEVLVEYVAKMPYRGRYLQRYGSYSGPLPRIQLRTGDPDVSLIFGHEVGHHILDEELNIGSHLAGTMHEPISEAFCEYFGRCMASPTQPADEVLEQEVKALYHVPADYGQFVMEQLLAR